MFDWLIYVLVLPLMKGNEICLLGEKCLDIFYLLSVAMTLIVKHVVCFISSSILVTYPMHLPLENEKSYCKKAKSMKEKGNRSKPGN